MTTARTNLPKVFKVERTTATSGEAFGAQRTFFYLNREFPGHPSGWILGGLALEGPLDPQALENALRELVRRNSIFRTGLEEVRWGELRQHVLPFDPARISLERTDLSGLDPEEQQRAQNEITEQMRSETQDLATGPGFRAHLIRLAPERHVLALRLHHIAADGAEMGVLQEDLGRLYAGSATDENPLCFIDFVDSITRWTEGPEGQTERAFWRERLAGAPPLELPTDRPRAEIDARRDAVPFGFASEPMSRLASQFSEEVRAGVTRLATAEGTSPSAVYLAATAYVLHGLTGQTDICIESAQNYRMARPILEKMHGSLATPRVMRIDVSGNPSWHDVIRRTKQVVNDAYRRCWVPTYDLAPHPIRRLLFNFLPYVADKQFQFTPDLKTNSVDSRFPDDFRRHWDLQLLVFEQSRTVLLFYSLSLFDKATAQSIVDRYLALIQSAV